MGDKSAIQWTDATWNPVTGCTKVSPGCAHCYAEDVANRFWARQYPLVGDDGCVLPEHRKFTDVWTHPDRLDQPLRWKKPRRVLVNSMSDLFHEDIPDEFIDQVFAVMALAPTHTFQVLTKRAERMRDYTRDAKRRIRDLACTSPGAMKRGDQMRDFEARWPLPNVWLGVSVENQATADERIPLLLQTPAAVRFLSCEPLLGSINLQHALGRYWRCPKCGTENGCHVGSAICFDCKQRTWPPPVQCVDWVIVGGESGPKSRPCEVAWIRSIRDQCLAAKVPCFVKQLGSRVLDENGRRPKLLDRKGGKPFEWPADLRVREFPTCSP